MAALPGFVIISLVACSLGGGSGTILQSAETLIGMDGLAPSAPYNAAVYGAPAAFGALDMLKKASNLKALAVGTGAGLVSVVCAELSEIVTKFGIEYLFE